MRQGPFLQVTRIGWTVLGGIEERILSQDVTNRNLGKNLLNQQRYGRLYLTREGRRGGGDICTEERARGQRPNPREKGADLNEST